MYEIVFLVLNLFFVHPFFMAYNSLISALNVGYMVLTEKNYPDVLAFSFLEETQKEFLLTYENNIIQSATRPYKFIEFGKKYIDIYIIFNIISIKCQQGSIIKREYS